MGKKIHIISGGTVAHIATHLAICAPAYGQTGSDLFSLCLDTSQLDIELHETKMADMGNGSLETNEDVEALIDQLVADPDTKIVFMPVALCDFEPVDIQIKGGNQKPTKGGPRLKTRDQNLVGLVMRPAPKIIQKIRTKRKDIFLVGFKTTDGISEDDQYRAGLKSGQIPHFLSEFRS